MKQKSWISIVFSFASQCRGKIVLSVLCAIISVVAGLIPYWSVYQIITLFIGGSPVMAEVWKWCWIGLGAYAIRFLLYGISTSLSHISAYTILENIRLTLAQRLMKRAVGDSHRRVCGKLKSRMVDRVETIELPLAHMIPECISNLLLPVAVFVYLVFIDWRMALAAVWVLPVAFAVTFFSARIQEYFNRRSMAANVALEEGVQECLESLQDLKANNGEARYLKGLDQKIDDVEKRHIITELGTALFVVSSTLILKFGIATVALTGAVLLIRGEIDIPLFFLFLLVASRLYAPLEGALQNLAAVISTRTNIRRMNEILDHPVQTGARQLSNQGYDIEI